MQRFILVVSRATLSLLIFLLVFSSIIFPRATVYAQTTVTEVVTVTAQVGGGGGIGGSGGGGTGGQQILPDTTVRIRGFAYPLSTVTLLRNNVVAASTITGASPSFELALTGITPGVHTFSIYSQDARGVLSRPVSVTVVVHGSAITTVSGVIIPPTLDAEMNLIRPGDPVTLFGQSAPFAEIEIALVNQTESYNTTANGDGLFSYILDTSSFEAGRFFVTARANIYGELSELSTPLGFTIRGAGESGDGAGTPGWILRGDVNKDNRVNLLDLTIMRSWYRSPLSTSMRGIESERLSGDAKVDLTDFSIAAYYWTG